ncbi:hypothetical protein [Sphingobium sp. B2]|uniref:Abi-alpha family protein n=1 Tax=Sphingobium sp. B2 TaxID=2583228 RepID=UPI00119EE302|nr:hypothetical protein [Sphingobium sp. B2]
MPDDPDFKLQIDVPALSTLADTTDRLLEAGTKGLGSFLSSLCQPGANEMGLLIQDKIRGWRAQNFAKYEPKVARMIEALNIENPRLAPRLLTLAVESASQIEDDDIQNVWAGLLAGSSRSEESAKKSLLFMQILESLSPECVRIIAMSMTPPRCINLSENRGVAFYGNKYALEMVLAQSGCSNPTDLGDVISRLVGLGLLNVASGISEDVCSLVPQPLGANLVARAEGHDMSAKDAYGPAIDFSALSEEERSNICTPIISVTTTIGPRS